MKYLQTINSNTLLINKIRMFIKIPILIASLLLILYLIFPNNAFSYNDPISLDNNDIMFGISYDFIFIDEYLSYQQENNRQNDNETDNQDEENDKETEDDDNVTEKTEKEKLREVLNDFDRNLIERIADALNIIYSDNDDTETIIDLILGRIDIIEQSQDTSSDTNQDDQQQDQQEDSDQQSDTDRTDIKSPLSDETWNLDFNTLSLSTFKVGDKDYTKLIAYGNCVITFGPTTLKSDLIILNRPPEELADNSTDEEDKKTNIEVMVFGNIEIDSGGNIFLAERGFFYPDDLNTILYDVIAYFPESSNSNFILKADTVKLITGTDEIIGIKIEASSSHYEFPHYKFTGNKIWYYPETENIFISNMTFQVGQSILLYFPFLFQTQFSSGIRTDMRYQRGIGFYIQTSTPFNILDFSNSLFLDYYQRMGIYFKLAEPVTLPFFSLDFSGAFDRAVRDVRGARFPEIYSNYVDIDNDGIYDETFRSFRYDFSLQSAELSLFEGEEVNLEEYLSNNEGQDILEKLNDTDLSTLKGLISSIVSSSNVTANYSFTRKSDPLFPSQFNEIAGAEKRELFDLQTTINEASSDAPSATAPDVPGGSSEAMSMIAGLNITTDFFRFDFSGDWKWSFTSKVGELNPYDVLNYYDYQKESAQFPYINLNFTDLFKIDNLIDNIIKTGINLFDIDKEYEQFADLIEKMTLKLNFSVTNFSFNSTPNITYYTDTTEIKETEDDRDENFGEILKDQTLQTSKIAHRTYFEIGYNENMVLFTTTMTYNLTHKYQSTKIDRTDNDKTAEEIQQDDIDSTYFNWTWNLTPTLRFDLFQKYEFLNFNFSISFPLSKSGKFDDLVYHLGLSDIEIGNSETYSSQENDVLSLPLNLSFFKISISFTGITIPLSLSDSDLEILGDIIKKDSYEYYDLEDIYILVDKEYLFEEKKSREYVFTINFNRLIDNLTLNLSYNEYNKFTFLDYYYEDQGGRYHVNELYGYPSLFGGRGNYFTLNLGYLFKFGIATIPDTSFTNNLNVVSTYKHYFGNAEYVLDTLDITLNYDLDISRIFLNSIVMKTFSTDLIFNHHFGYEQFKDDTITINLNVDFDLGSLWNLSVDYQVKNNNIWRYFQRDDNPNPINPFYDLFLAISIWDAESLTGTFWKMQSLSFTLNHDLAEWIMDFTIEVNFEVDPIFGYITFKPTFTFTIELLDIPTFSGGSDGEGAIIDRDFFDRF